MSPATRPKSEPLPMDAPLKTYYRLFHRSAPITQEEFQGDFEGLIIGPLYFKTLFVKMLKWGGLAGWTGKQFADGEGTNIVQRNGQSRQVARMRVTGTTPSVIDGQTTLTLGYYKKPLAFVQDEIRKYDERTVLGMTYCNIGPLKRLPMPFALRRRK